ncbi:AraC family transcriptional regulator [Paenibacillus sp. Soil766]|nr:AraC family transcriptional regulator [Paenibacillus sp. Soil766]
MTYPQELKENTNLLNGHFPLNIFRNQVSAGSLNRCILGLHWHEHFEIIYMMTGSAIFHIDSQPYEVSPHDILIVPAGGLHVGYSLTEERVEYLAIVFNATLLNAQFPNPVHNQFIAPILDGQVSFPIKHEGNEPGIEPLRQVILRAIDEFERKELAYEIAVQSQLYYFFTLLSRKYLPDRRLKKTSAAYSHNIARFKKLILHVENHYASKITIDEAAQIVCMNAYHFCKTFKKMTGRTFIEFVNLHRMDEAQRLLEETDLTVTEISEILGCGNPNYFTKLFKKYKGIAPSHIRKVLGKSDS